VLAPVLCILRQVKTAQTLKYRDLCLPASLRPHGVAVNAEITLTDWAACLQQEHIRLFLTEYTVEGSNSRREGCLYGRVYILTMEFTVDLDNGLRWGKLTVHCLWPVTDVLQF